MSQTTASIHYRAQHAQNPPGVAGASKQIDLNEVAAYLLTHLHRDEFARPLPRQLVERVAWVYRTARQDECVQSTADALRVGQAMISRWAHDDGLPAPSTLLAYRRQVTAWTGHERLSGEILGAYTSVLLQITDRAQLPSLDRAAVCLTSLIWAHLSPRPRVHLRGYYS